MNIIDIIWELPEKMGSLSETLQTFIFSSVTIGDLEISFWGLLGGALITVFIVAALIGAIRG